MLSTHVSYSITFAKCKREYISEENVNTTVNSERQFQANATHSYAGEMNEPEGKKNKGNIFLLFRINPQE